MKLNKRLVAFVIALFMVISIASPALATPDEPAPSDEKGSLTIHKLYFSGRMGEVIPGTGETQTPPAGALPLKGAEFSVWKTSPDATLPNIFRTLDPQYKIVTDAAGLAFFDNLPYGRYYVEETLLPAGVTQGSAPFIIDIPTTSADETRLIDDVHVYPKNVLVLGAAQIHKMDEQKNGLEGAIFSLYKKGNPDVVIASGITTDANGWTVVQENLVSGDYYFIETQAPSGYLLDETKVEFTVGSGNHAYTNGSLNPDKIQKLHLTNSEKPGTPKKEANVDNAGIGDKVTWTITNKLPGNIKTYTAYKISDMLDAALNYNNNVVVKLDGVPLILGTDYTLVEPATTGGGLLEINFIPGQLSAGNLVVTFDTIVNEKAKAGVNIKNQAILVYDNGFVVDKDESNIPEVKVGGHKFRKIDKSEKALEGAEFIVRRATDNKYLVKDGNGMISWSDDEADAFKFESGNTGELFVDGLAFGDYFLIETKAPAGYSLLQNPTGFTVGENTHTIIMNIINKTKPGMPQTGGIGTMLFTAIGLAFMGIAAKTYKKEEK